MGQGTRGQDVLAERDEPDLADAAALPAADGAKLIRERIEKRFAQNPEAKPVRIAVFPFGDPQGKITQQNHDVLFQAQGAYAQALGQELAKDAKGKFLILDKFAVARQFKDSGIDPAAVSPENTDLPPTLSRLGIDAAVLGSVVYDLGWTIRPTLVFAGEAGQGNMVSTPASQPAMVTSAVSTWLPTSRLAIELWLRKGNTYEFVPIVTTRSETNFEQSNVWYAVLPPGSEGTEYIVRLANRGMTRETDAFSMSNPDPAVEARRLFGIALTVDGVNSFFEDLGDGERKPAVVHPRKATKWVLSPPGHRIVPADNASGYVLAREQGAGHSIFDVQGFQTDNKTARAFTISPSSLSVAAESVGITDEIGVITAYIFGEKLPGDQITYASQQEPAALGTTAGRQLHQPVMTIRPKFHKEPFLTIKIFYRSADEIPIPRSERVQIAGGR
jgi:hypothetical protein